MIKQDKNSRWSQLSLKEKAEIIGLYVKNGYSSRDDIVTDFNKSYDNFQSSPANFVSRLRNNDTRSIPDENGIPMTHRMSYITEDGGAVMFPEVQNVDGTLQIGGYNSAVNQRDTVHTSVPFAEWYSRNYKKDYPKFFNKFDDGSFKINENYVHPTISEDNRLSTKIWAKSPRLLQRLKKAGTLGLDLARVLPYSALVMDFVDSYSANKRDTRDINDVATNVGLVGRVGDAMISVIEAAQNDTPFKLNSYSPLKVLGVPDLISDSVKFIKDFATPIEEYSYGGPLVYSFSKQPIPAVKYDEGGLKQGLQKLFAKSYNTETFGEAFRQARIDGLNYFKWNGKRYNTKLSPNPFVEAARNWNTNGDLAKEDFIMQIKRNPQGVLDYYNKMYPANRYKTLNKEINQFNLDRMYSLGTKGLKELVIPRNTKYSIGDEIWNELNNSNLSHNQKLSVLANSFHETNGWTALTQYGKGPAKGAFMMESSETAKYNRWLQENGYEDTIANQTRYVINLLETQDASLQTAWDRAGNKQEEIKTYKDSEEAKKNGYRSAYAHLGYTTEQAYNDWNSNNLDNAVTAFEGLFERAGKPQMENRKRIAALLSKRYTQQ